MKRIVLALVAAMLANASAARAEWLLVSQDGFSKIYMEPASRKAQAGGVVTLEALTDYDPKSPEAENFKLSQKGLSEIEAVAIDCQTQKYRSGGGTWFAGQMATGAVRSDYPAKAAWSKVPEFYAGLFQKVCASP